VFPSLVGEINQVMPDLRLILIGEKTAAPAEKLRPGEIDAALMALPVHDDFLVTHPLFDDEFYLAVPSGHDLTRYATIDQTKLSGHRLLLLEEGRCLRDQALDVCQLNGISEEQDFKATGLETLRQMVRAGTGITFIPEIAKHAHEPGIEYIPFEAPAPVRTIGLVWRKTTTRQAVIEQLIGTF
jgi:LysR family hydrogen peroxide-inducible transcriptional activator